MLFLIFGCESGQNASSTSKSNKKGIGDISSFVSEFYFEARLRNINIQTQMVYQIKEDNDSVFVNSTDVAGWCFGMGIPNITRAIYIKRSFWENSTYAQKKAVVFHELGHCLLNRGHAPFGIKMDSKNFYPASIMFPRCPSDYYFQMTENKYKSAPDQFMIDHWNSYIDELFSSDTNKLAQYGSIYFQADYKYSSIGILAPIELSTIDDEASDLEYSHHPKKFVEDNINL